ncbi:MAG: pyruvate formate lyase family protein, partial [Candidatus Thorarchaeota archaeon]
MTERTQKLMMDTPIKSLQVANLEIADDARANRPGMRWSLDLERAKLLTESYKHTEGKPMVLRRAYGLRYVLENMTVYIRPDELIVGNFASTPDSVVHYPEFSYKWVERETAPGQIYADML